MESDDQDVKIRLIRDEDTTNSDKTAPKSWKRKAAPANKVTKRRKVNEIGKVFVIGDNLCGQLGFNPADTEKKKTPTLLEIADCQDIAAGGMHSVCLTQTGEVITFGCNDDGALGRMTEEDKEYFPGIVDIPEKIIQITAGDSHSAALSESGKVYVWGNFKNNSGDMGLIEPTIKQPLPVKILHGVTVVKIASGNDHLTCFCNEGRVYTLGNGEVGQLGRVSERNSTNGGRQGMSLLLLPQIVPIRESGSRNRIVDIWTSSYATFLKSNSAVYAFGLNNYGQLGVNPDERILWKPKKIETFEDTMWTQIDGGDHHTLALDSEDVVYSLGRRDYGRLGLGEDCEDVSRPTLIPSLQERKCISVSCGGHVSLALEDNGSIYSWGFGANHQLGHGNGSDKYIPQRIEGNFLNLWRALKISGGGQHTLILAKPRNF